MDRLIAWIGMVGSDNSLCTQKSTDSLRRELSEI